jgi:hypothetical protein
MPPQPVNGDSFTFLYVDDVRISSWFEKTDSGSWQINKLLSSFQWLSREDYCQIFFVIYYIRVPQ